MVVPAESGFQCALRVGSVGSGPDTLALLLGFLTKDSQERETCALPYPQVWCSGLRARLQEASRHPF